MFFGGVDKIEIHEIFPPLPKFLVPLSQFLSGFEHFSNTVAQLGECLNFI